MANNPSHEGLKAIRDFYPNLQIALVVSLGTGKYNEREIKEADIITCLRSFRIKEAALGLKNLIESTLQVCYVYMYVIIIGADVYIRECSSKRTQIRIRTYIRLPYEYKDTVTYIGSSTGWNTYIRAINTP